MARKPRSDAVLKAEKAWAKRFTTLDSEPRPQSKSSSHLGNTVEGHELGEALKRATENIVMESITEGTLGMADDMGHSELSTQAALLKNDVRSKSVQRMSRRMEAELAIIVDEVEELDTEINRLQALRTEKMHAASMLQHGLAAGE